MKNLLFKSALIFINVILSTIITYIFISTCSGFKIDPSEMVVNSSNDSTSIIFRVLAIITFLCSIALINTQLNEDKK